MSKEAREFAAILKNWGPTLQRAVTKANSNRWPSGAPGGKGGQFAPGKGGGSAPYSTSNAGFKPKQMSLFNYAPNAPQLSAGKPKQDDYGAFGKPMMAGATKWTQSGSQLMGDGEAPKLPPPGAKPHPQMNDKGQPVTINYPTKPSDPATWKNPDATATFTPGSATPAVLNGVPMKPWKAPERLHEWANVEGQKPELDRDFPLEPTPGKSVGAGVIIQEPDGRVWLTKPTNEFGGYKHTLPKGTVEHGLSLQASAIKEAVEETGLKIRITGILGDYERTTSVARFYIAQRVGGTPAAMGWETQALRLVPLEEAKKYLNMKVDHGIIDDYRHDFVMKRAPLSLVRHHAVIEEEVARRGLDWLYKAGKPTGGGHWQHQERWPAGTPLGGQWKAMGADGLTLPPSIAGGLAGSNKSYQVKANAIHAAAQGNDLKTVLDQAVQLEKKVQADKAAGKKTTHVKWTAQLSQYTTQLVADMTAKPKAEAAATKITGPEKLSSFTHAGAKPGGSNDGAVYTDKDGTKWLVKGNNYASTGGMAMSDDRAKNEVLASKLMAAAGISGPEIKLVDLEGKHQGNLGVAVKWIDGLQKFNPTDAGQLSAVQDQYAVHAWLGNWDVLGMSLDNTAFKDGKAINIDPGGSILFRAQGAPKKEGLFGKDAADWESMRSTDQHQKSVYGKMTFSQLQESAKHLANVTDDTINKLVDVHGPGDLKAKVALAQTLIARRDAILEKAGLKTIFTPAPHAEPMPAPEPPKIADAVPAPANTAPPQGVTKPVFNANIGNSDIYYAGLAENAQDFHAAGDLAGLKAMVNPKKNPGTWGNKTVNSKKLVAYHSALVADLEMKQQQAAAQVSAGQATVTDTKGQEWKATDGVLNPVGNKAAELSAKTKEIGATGDKNAMSAHIIAIYQNQKDGLISQEEGARLLAGASKAYDSMGKAPPAAAPAPAPMPAAPALPDFQSKKLKPSNSNAPSVNKKIDEIEALAKKGDVKGLLALKYTTNTYGHQSVALANDALAALGSPHKVVAGQAANSHPALVNGTTQNAPVTASVAPLPKPAEPAKPKPTFKPELISKPPTFMASAVPAVNEANNAAAQEIYKTAQTGDMHALQNLKFEQLDKGTQQKTGVLLSFDQHPSKGVQAYYGEVQDEITAQLTGKSVGPQIGPVQLSQEFQDLSEALKPVPMGSSIAKVPDTQKIGKYIVLGKAPSIPKVATINTIMGKSSWAKWAKNQYEAASKSAKSIFSHYITSHGAGVVNDALRAGKDGVQTSTGMNVKEYVEKFNKELTVDIPEGAKFTRSMGTKSYGGKAMTHAEVQKMISDIKAAGPGTVLQEPGFSSSSHGMSILNGNDIQWQFTAGQGVKAYPAWLTENAGEGECLFPPNTRYLVTGYKHEDGKFKVEALLLPSV